MTDYTPWDEFHSAETAALLIAAFCKADAIGEAGNNCVFRVTTRSGSKFEGDPEHAHAWEVREILYLAGTTFVLVSQIEAIEVLEAQDQ